MSDWIGEELSCKRCGHKWYGRVPRRPVQCPQCKSTAWDEATRVAEAKVQYRPGSPVSKKGLSIRRGTRKFGDWSKHPAFGIWADRTDTDDELLTELRRGWGDPKKDR